MLDSYVGARQWRARWQQREQERLWKQYPQPTFAKATAGRQGAPPQHQILASLGSVRGKLGRPHTRSWYPSIVKTQTLPLSALNDSEAQTLLTKHAISLTVREARTIADLLGRDPTLVEATIWSIQGSEHCSYKSSKRFLREFPTSGKHVILGPKEDSGIIAITDGPPGERWGIVVSHESHNHPSQIVPYEGAATGVGGIVRDVLCMGARVVGLLDALRLGDLKTPESRTIAREIVRGIGGYGNPLGIPNLGGDTQFDSAYNFNCLVNVVCHGIVRENEIIHSEVPKEAGNAGDDIIVVGKPTDRSGFGGAAFASLALDGGEREKNTGAVQEPNPFLERHLLASTYALFDWLAANGKLDKVSFKDLGAGGVVCATVEQVAASGLGAEIELSNVHTVVCNLPPEIIACAETQERMCWICHPDLTEHILHHYNSTWDLPGIAEDARASVIGKVTEGPIYRLRFRGEVVCEAKAKDITCGLECDRPVREPVRRERRGNGSHPRQASSPRSIEEIFRTMIAHPNHAGKSPIFRHYDKNVIGNTIIESGEADAGVIAPLQDLQCYIHEGMHPGWDKVPEADRWIGVAVACDGNGRYGRISPYLQGANAAVEAMRNVAAVGAVPRALTDCLNYGNPEVPEELWELAEGVRGIADAARGVDIDGEPIPVIGGNVSFYNSSPAGSIPPTAIVSCIGVIPDARKAVTMAVKEPGAMLLLVGERMDECGTNVPTPDFAEVKKQILFVTEAIQRGLVQSCHDISDGGLLMALFEMLVPQHGRKATFGVHVTLNNLASELPSDTVLFSETGGFVLAAGEQYLSSLRALSEKHHLELFNIGKTTSNHTLAIEDVASFDIPTLVEVWRKPLAELLAL